MTLNNEFTRKVHFTLNTTEQNKSLYGDGDQRLGLHELESTKLDPTFIATIKKQAESIACLVSEDFLVKKDNGGWQFHSNTPTLSQNVERQFQGEGASFGEQEAFRDELAPGFGTAFLVGKKFALTAAHCVCNKNSNTLNLNLITKTRLVFGFHEVKKNPSDYFFSKKQVYQIKKVVLHQFLRLRDKNHNYIEWTDWALLELKKEVPFAPLRMNMTEKIADEIELYMLGHPSGLPLKFTGGGFVQGNTHKDFFECNLDAFGGNSGSFVAAVSTEEGSGMLCSGDEDYEITDNYKKTGKRRIQACHITKRQIAQSRVGDRLENCQRINSLRFMHELLGLKMIEQQNSPELIIKALQDNYKSQKTIPRLLYSALPIEEIYTDLVLLQQDQEEQEATFQENRIHSWEDVKGTKKHIELENLFGSDGQKKYLILGRAGIGKSILCQYIAYQWAKNELWKGKFDALFWIPLRKLQYAHTAETTASFLFRICCQENGPSLYPKDIADYIQQNKERILFVLDGLDEVTMEENSVQKAIYDELVKFPHWIVTSRPHAAKSVPECMIIENVGFASKTIDLYIQKSFHNKAKEVIQKIYQNPIIFGLCHIPINLELICSILQRSKRDISFIKSMTDLYEELTLTLQRRFLEKIGKPNPWDWEAGDLEEDSQVALVFSCLEKIAWTGMKEGQLIFSLKEGGMKKIYSQYPPSEERKQLFSHICESGFMQSSGVEYSFVHFTFQELFAARYLVQMLKENLALGSELIREIKFDPRYKIIMGFVAGLLKRQPKLLNAFFAILDTPKDQVGFYATLLKIHCLDECGWPADLKKANSSTIEFWCHKLNFKSWLDSMARHLMETFEISPKAVQHFLIPHLQNLFTVENWQVRVNVINVLGQLGHTKPTEILPLLADAIKETNQNVCEAAIRALGGLGYVQPDHVIQLLVETIKDHYNQLEEKKDLKSRPIITDKDISEQSILLIKKQQQGLFIPLYPTPLTINQKGDWIRSAISEAFWQLGQTNPQIVIPLLEVHLQNENEWVRRVVKSALDKINQNQWKLPIRTSPIDTSPKKKKYSLPKLSDFYPQGIRPSLSDLLKEIQSKIKENDAAQDEEHQTISMQNKEDLLKLNSSDTKRMVPILVEVLKDRHEDHEIKKATCLALIQLAQIHPDIAFPLFEKTLQDENEDISFSTMHIFSLIAIDNPQFNFSLSDILLFLQILETRSTSIVMFDHVIVRMSQIDPKSVFHFLAKSLNNVKSSIRRQAIQLLDELSPWSPDISVPFLADALADNRYWNARIYMTKVLKQHNLASYLKSYPKLLWNSYFESNPRDLHNFYETKSQGSLLASTPLSALIACYEDDPSTYAQAITIKCIEENLAIFQKEQTLCFYEQNEMHQMPLQHSELFSQIEEYTHEYPEFIANYISLQPSLDYIEYSERESLCDCCRIF